MSLKVNQICAGYGKTNVLKDMTTEFEAGKFHALIGPNGSGKSTLLKTIAGLIAPSSGHFEGLEEPLSHYISYLSQTRIAHPQMNVYNIVALGRLAFQKPFQKMGRNDETSIKTALEKTNLSDMQDVKFGTLSGGQQARVLLARALAVNAPLILVDEPVAALDPFYQISILEVLKAEARSGKTVIAALHDLSLVKQFADTVCVLNQGGIYIHDTPQKALTADTLKTVFRIEHKNGVNRALT